MSYLKTQMYTHRQQVTRLYKAAVRDIKSWYPQYHEWRFHVAILRDRFDQNKNITNLFEAKKLLLEGQSELQKKRHPFPFKFAESPGGIGFGRNPPLSDYLFDLWHPMEKAQYPDFFAKRSQLKKEYIDWYVKKYGITKFNPEEEGDLHDHDHEHGDHKAHH